MNTIKPHGGFKASPWTSHFTDLAFAFEHAAGPLFTSQSLCLPRVPSQKWKVWRNCAEMVWKANSLQTFSPFTTYCITVRITDPWANNWWGTLMNATKSWMNVCKLSIFFFIYFQFLWFVESFHHFSSWLTSSVYVTSLYCMCEKWHWLSGVTRGVCWT